jgi:hypothetical protein
MGDSKYITQVKASLADEKETLTDKKVESSVYVFFSFDLTNSTKYKTINRYKWPLVTSRFYELIEDGLKKRLDQVRLWKYVGDELLLHKRLYSIRDLYDCIPSAYNVLQDTVNRLHKEFPDTKTILSVKASVWCAKAAEVAPQDTENISIIPKNLVVSKSGGQSREQYDFLGPDIDVGFRISKFAPRARLVVSADLAYLLYKERVSIEGIEQKLRIVSYEQLKGVWGDRKYPIIWYENDWSNISKSFLYDEHFDSDLIQRVRGNAASDISDLVKVYEDLDRRDEVEELWSYVKNLPAEAKEEATPSELSQAHLVEVHCVAVCFRQDGRILIARRPQDKRRLGGAWEFGCGQLRIAEDFEECLTRSYRDDFGAELSFTRPLRPVATYVIDDPAEKRKIPGIIFTADVTNHQQVRSIRHSEIDWIDPTTADALPDDEVVPNFKDTIRLALIVRTGERG